MPKSDPRRRLFGLAIVLAVGATACGPDVGEGPPADAEVATSTIDAGQGPSSTESASDTTATESETTSTTVENEAVADDVSSAGTIGMASGDVLAIGPVGDVVPAVDLSDSTVVRCPPGRDSEGSIAVMVRTDSIIFLASINEISLSHHSVMVYEEGVGRFESEATSSLNRSQWFDADGNELPGPLLNVANGRISGSVTLGVDGYEETRELDFDLPLPTEIAGSEDCVR